MKKESPRQTQQSPRWRMRANAGEGNARGTREIGPASGRPFAGARECCRVANGRVAAETARLGPSDSGSSARAGSQDSVSTGERAEADPIVNRIRCRRCLRGPRLCTASRPTTPARSTGRRCAVAPSDPGAITYMVLSVKSEVGDWNVGGCGRSGFNTAQIPTKRQRARISPRLTA